MEAEAKAKAKAATQSEMADGEIRKINKNTGKITVKHGEIKSVEMPPMTMVFGVADKAMLEGLKEGDKVKFNVKQEVHFKLSRNAPHVCIAHPNSNHSWSNSRLSLARQFL
eukprot:gene5213-7074_t